MNSSTHPSKIFRNNNSTSTMKMHFLSKYALIIFLALFHLTLACQKVVYKRALGIVDLWHWASQVFSIGIVDLSIDRGRFPNRMRTEI